MKNIKNTMGREGYGCLATLYLDGEKIGTYADYGDGGEEEVSYVSKEAEEKMTKFIIEYAKARPNELIEDILVKRPEQYKSESEWFKKQHPYIPESDINIRTMASNSIVYPIAEFLDIHDMEKRFKSYEKKGYGAISYNEISRNITAYPKAWSEDRIREEAEKAGDERLYFSLDDFDISKAALAMDALTAAQEKPIPEAFEVQNEQEEMDR